MAWVSGFAQGGFHGRLICWPIRGKKNAPTGILAGQFSSARRSASRARRSKTDSTLKRVYKALIFAGAAHCVRYAFASVASFLGNSETTSSTGAASVGGVITVIGFLAGFSAPQPVPRGRRRPRHSARLPAGHVQRWRLCRHAQAFPPRRPGRCRSGRVGQCLNSSSGRAIRSSISPRSGTRRPRATSRTSPRCVRACI